MKKLIRFLTSAFALVAFSAGLHAQLSIQTTTLNGGTANVAASSTNALTAPVLVIPKASNVAIQASFKLDGAGTSAVVFNFDESIDNSVWKSNAQSLSVTASGTSVVNGIAKIATGGVGYLRLSSVQNPNTANITNLVLKYSYKTGL